MFYLPNVNYYGKMLHLQTAVESVTDTRKLHKNHLCMYTVNIHETECTEKAIVTIYFKQSSPAYPYSSFYLFIFYLSATVTPCPLFEP